MTDAEQREAARQFHMKWVGKGKEDEDDRSYWIDILERLLDVPSVTDHIDFQKKVIVDGNTKRIDAYIPETRVLIEQKSLGIKLDQKVKQSGGIELTPYEQAKRYNDNLPLSEKARYIVTSNFEEIWVYDMEERVPENKVEVINIDNLQNECYRLSFLVKQKVSSISAEMQVSIDAGKIVGLLYDAFYKQYGIDDISDEHERKRAFESLNILCVRIVFCLYAEDAGIFGTHAMFHDYLERFEVRDLRRALLDLFEVLNTSDGTNGTKNKRPKYLEAELAAFPYVNGGLFFGNYEIPPFTDEIRTLLLTKACDFDWHAISPTIFGAVFESTLNPETRRSGGMHYTSVENIHKVIDPLFLDDLKAELDEIKNISVVKTQKSRLDAYQEKLASLTFLDPACGSGNFLTETYLSLRRLENEVLELKVAADKKEVTGQISFANEATSPIKVSIQQFYGIEINDFAVTVAMTALFIAESQMLKETEAVVQMNIDYLPLKSYTQIVEGNALRMDWNEVVPKERLNYIMGNPPFVGHNVRSDQQKDDMRYVFNDIQTDKSDYVISWFYIAANYITDMTKVAFVSTNSICQGTSVGVIWKELFRLGIHISFAWNTFVWNSEAIDNAHVHVVIVGFQKSPVMIPVLFNSQTDEKRICGNINGYLLDAPDICIERQQHPISDVPRIRVGSLPRSSAFTVTADEKPMFIADNALCEKWIRPYIGADEFINKRERYCLWLKGADISEIRKCKMVLDRVNRVREDRLSSSSAQTRRTADTPTLFAVDAQPNTNYLLIPQVSSERRRYVPIGFMSPEIIASNLVFVVPDATLFHFGVLTSNVHNAWMRTVCGRMKSDYRYGGDIVYNSFPWPETMPDQQSLIEKTAKGILDVRELYANNTLADLYDPLTMPPDLLKAHRENDRAVMNAYGFDIKTMSEAECVAELMKKYQDAVQKEGEN